MNLGVRKSIERYWNKSAPTYDSQFGHGLSSPEERDLWLDLLGRNIRFPRGSKILDVGCGTGFLSLLLAEMGFDVTGIDFSDNMRELAVQKAARQGLEIDFRHGDAEAPDFGHGSFDIVISRHLVWTLPDPPKAVANWKNLLKDNGAVIIIDGLWTPKDFQGRLRAFIGDAIRLVKGRKRQLAWKKEYVGDIRELPFFGGTEPETIVGLLEASGLKNIWRDDMHGILAYERRTAPLEYKIACSSSKDRRYLVGGYHAKGGVNG